jgi:hypothetical protein
MQNLKVYRIKNHGVKGRLGEENNYTARRVDNIGIRFIDFSLQSVYGKFQNHIGKQIEKELLAKTCIQINVHFAKFSHECLAKKNQIKVSMCQNSPNVNQKPF